VELLVVIGIIAVLIGILLPALNKARESANRAACASNMRQVAMAVMQYDIQYKRLPGPVIPAALDPDPANMALLSTTYRGDDPGTGTGNPPRVITPFLAPLLKNNRTVWFCPSGAELRTRAAPVSGTYAGKALGYLYKINNQSSTTPAYFFGSWNGPDLAPVPFKGSAAATTVDASGAPKGMPKQIKSVRSPYASSGSTLGAKVPVSEIWMMSDVDGRVMDTSTTGTFGIADKNLAFNARPWQPVHNSKKRGRNYVFFDAHVEYVYLEMEPPNP
jgi:prepilin-type processing-associated H-X9-DG protein